MIVIIDCKIVVEGRDVKIRAEAVAVDGLIAAMPENIAINFLQTLPARLGFSAVSHQPVLMALSELSASEARVDALDIYRRFFGVFFVDEIKTGTSHVTG